MPGPDAGSGVVPGLVAAGTATANGSALIGAAIAVAGSSIGAAIAVAYAGRTLGHIILVPGSHAGSQRDIRQVAVALADEYAVALAVSEHAR
mgnify:CR=1 FL=1